jgi:ubiquinone/menaquinone biosynthesis C-methylase UbiE
MTQVDALIEALRLEPDEHVLDLGCGNGMIAEYVADCTDARVTGIDYIPYAVQIAAERTAAKADQLSFVVGDINALELPPASFDAIYSIDSIYFSDDYARTIGQLAAALRSGGRLAFLYSYGREPWVPADQFPAEKLAAGCTPLADALNANGLRFAAQDFTAEDYRLAQLRRQVLADLRPFFEAEDLLFVYENRMGDANGVSAAIEEGLQRRYLYLAWRDDA